MKGTRAYVDVLEQLIRDWPTQVRRAMYQGKEILYVGTVDTSRRSFIYEMLNPKSLLARNEKNLDPAYLTLEEANVGCENQSGTTGKKHECYVVIDVVNREVMNLVDRNGHTMLAQTQLEQMNAIGIGMKEAARVLEWYKCAYTLNPIKQSFKTQLEQYQQNAFKKFQFVFAPNKAMADEAIATAKQNTGEDLIAEQVTPELIEQFYLAHAKFSAY